MNFFEHQQQARNKTKILVIYFVLAVITIAFTVNFAIYLSLCVSQIVCTSFENYWQKKWWLLVTLVTLGIITLTSLLRWYQLRRQGGLKAVLMAGAVPVDLSSQKPEYQQLVNVVEEMSIASGMPVPKIYVMTDELGINAFVAGTEPHNTYLAVTRGCIEQLNRDELQGVIAHEYSHILNGDMRINLKIVGVLAGITVIGQLGEFLISSGRRTSQKNIWTSKRQRKNSLQAPLIGLAIVIVGYVGLFFGRLIKSAISRQREFLADASAVQFTRSKAGITNALNKIEQHRFGAELTVKSAEELSHMCFGSSHKLSFFKKLLSTHPPTQDRIRKIDPYFSASVKRRQTPDNHNKKDESKQPEADSSVTPVEVVGSALLVSQIGSLKPNHIEQAKLRLSQINQQLASIARGQNNEISAHYLAYGLLAQENTLASSELFDLAKNWLTTDEIEKVAKITDALSLQTHEQKWILLELAIPRIKLLSNDDKKDFLAKMKQLADCDKNVSLKEYLIFSISKRWIDNSPQPDRTFNNYKKLSVEILYLLNILLKSNSNSREKNNTLRENAVASLWLSTQVQQSQVFNANTFHKALLRVSRLNPLLKAPLIETFTTCIASDNRVSKEEYLLIRVICEYLDCPLPVIM